MQPGFAITSASVMVPERIYSRVAKVLRKDRPDLGEANVSAALAHFDKMWTALIPAEQARVVQPLVARVTVGEAALAVGVVTAGPAARTRGIAAGAFVRRGRAAMGRSLPAGV